MYSTYFESRHFEAESASSSTCSVQRTLSLIRTLVLSVYTLCTLYTVSLYPLYSACLHYLHVLLYTPLPVLCKTRYIAHQVRIHHSPLSQSFRCLILTRNQCHMTSTSTDRRTEPAADVRREPPRVSAPYNLFASDSYVDSVFERGHPTPVSHFSGIDR